ncbi:hypothetical protein LPB140_11170 [Sphingorhabdus lutea]|uniref:CoA transferase n=2 Tax=Sphingorhabdus lutea TaxID=1913578 RepID=A0A1L3JDP3_9SPHN|nr:hypothetical protein LPB140_11170 [Sphingorhabdus lutea]
MLPNDEIVDSRPLCGFRVVELAGIGPGPYAGQLLADMGADVIIIDRPLGKGAMPHGIDGRGKKSIALDLRRPEAVDIVLQLVSGSDILIEGLRPGVTERLGVGPDACFAVNPKLIYGRMTGWGQNGPWAQMAGHDINYISMTGALHAMGQDGQPPMPPLNLVGDFGGGSLFLVNGILAALLKAQKNGQGSVVDAAIVDGVNHMMSFIHGMAGLGAWVNKRQANLLDGAAPFYRCYMTHDNKFMAVGCIEPQFFAEMARLLNLDLADFGGQNDRSKWPAQHEKLAQIFASKSRDEWEEIFIPSDACVTPVLDYEESICHPANAQRETHKMGGAAPNGKMWQHPQSAPILYGQAAEINLEIAQNGRHSEEILRNLGFDDTKIEQLFATQIAYKN